MRITLHMIESVDGKILTARWSLPEGFKAGELYEAVASGLNAEGWIVGRYTMAEYAASVHSEASQLTDRAVTEARVFNARPAGMPLAVVYGLNVRLSFDESTLPTGEHILAVLPVNVPAAHLQSLRQKGISYVLVEGGDNALAEGLLLIEKHFKVRHLLLEGGGIINAAFLEKGLIDALSVIICPCVDGNASATALFNHVGNKETVPGAREHFAFEKAELTDGAVHLMLNRI